MIKARVYLGSGKPMARGTRPLILSYKAWSVTVDIPRGIVTNPAKSSTSRR